MALSPERRSARQRHLVEVAQALVREGGDAGFSMTQLAARAGVSPATPYNLVGAKSDILRLVVRAEFDSFAEKLGQIRRDSALATLLEATALVVTHYEGDRQFYRGLFRAAFGMEASEVHDLMHVEGQTLWSSMVAEAVRQGELESFVQVAPLTNVVLWAISMTTQGWLSEGWTHERYAMEMAHAVRLTLAGVATAKAREGLVAEIARLQLDLAHAIAAPDSGESRVT